MTAFTNDPAARAMLTGAIVWNFARDAEALLKTYAKLVPRENYQEFADRLAECKLWAPDPTTANPQAAPDLFGDEAYRDWVQTKMEI